MSTPRHCLRVVALCATIAVWAGSASAVDGVIQINQARALAGGVTSGDTAGFPVTLSQSGSYRLTGNLTVPNENTSGITIVAGALDVSVDLNGFSISGPAACSGGGSGLSCAASGSGVGVGCSEPTVESVSVSNGAVRGMGNFGIDLLGGSGVNVQRVQVVGNAGGGIRVLHGQTECSVTHSAALRNGGNGIETGNVCSVSGNRVIANLASGISVSGGTIKENTVDSNGEAGITQNDGYAVIADNIVSNNEGLGIECSPPGNMIRGNTVGQNGAGGIYGGDPAMMVLGNTVDQNNGNGIETGDGANVTGNTVGGNNGNGIVVTNGSTVQQNSVYASSSFGLDASAPETGYSQNVFHDNNGGGGNPQVNDGTQIGNNLCDGALCP